MQEGLKGTSYEYLVYLLQSCPLCVNPCSADVNVTNKGTGWTPCHCAAFQGHGKVMLYLSQHKPDVTMEDLLGR